MRIKDSALGVSKLLVTGLFVQQKTKNKSSAVLVLSGKHFYAMTPLWISTDNCQSGCTVTTKGPDQNKPWLEATIYVSATKTYGLLCQASGHKIRLHSARIHYLYHIEAEIKWLPFCTQRIEDMLKCISLIKSISFWFKVHNLFSSSNWP